MTTKPFFEATRTIRLADTDAAGILYFARALDLAHSVYEEWIAENGWNFSELLFELDWKVPIVHAEVTHEAPCEVGDELTVRLEPERVGTTSFTLGYTFRKAERVVIRASTTHVTVDKESGRPRPLDERVRASLDGS